MGWGGVLCGSGGERSGQWLRHELPPLLPLVMLLENSQVTGLWENGMKALKNTFINAWDVGSST